jgi:hypothetical protein
VGGVDAVFALKLVFWLVKRADSPQSERGLTALPYWDPAQPPPADEQPPMHTTWQKAVAIDPAGRYPVGSRQRVNVNGTLANPSYQLAHVVPLSRFYSHRLADRTRIMIGPTCRFRLKPLWNHAPRSDQNPVGRGLSLRR